LFARNKVNQEHLLKLYKPNDVVVAEIHGQPSAFVVHDRPQIGPRNCTTLNCWSFQTDGFGFARKLTVLSIPPVREDLAEVTSLAVYPLRFTSPPTLHKLQKNGRKQWDFRTISHVTYTGWNVEQDHYYVSKGI
jgi:hypothetical protein